MSTLTIGQLAKAAGVKLTTIRYYERCGILPQPGRSESVYLLYSIDFVTRIQFIKKAQLLGFTLEEINELLTLQADPSKDCSAVKTKAAQKIDAVEEKIKQLQQIRQALIALHQQCNGQSPVTDCPILKAFNH